MRIVLTASLLVFIPYCTSSFDDGDLLIEDAPGDSGDGWDDWEDSDEDTGEDVTDLTGDCEASGADTDDHTTTWDDPTDDDLANCDAGASASLGGTPYGTIQSAVRSAGDGDIVWVCPGTHTEQITVSTAGQLVLASLSGDPSDTILSGEGAHTILFAYEPAQLTVGNLGFHDGVASRSMSGDSDGGAIVAYEVDLHVQGCVFEDNSALYSGGALYYDSGRTEGLSLRVVDSHFEGNQADYSGGAIEASNATIDIQGSSFEDNSSDYEGGAISLGYQEQIFADITDCSFTDNENDYGGGAVRFRAADGIASTLRITSSSFDGNQANYEGGGISVGAWGLERLEIYDSVFTGNSATDSDGGAVQFGTWGQGCLYVQDSSFDGNSAERGGAIGIGGWAPYMSIEIDTSSFDGNQATHASFMNIDVEHANVIIAESSILGGTDNSAAAGLYADTNLDVIDTDWGTGATDNTPRDLNIGDEGFDDLGAGETFSCRVGSPCVF